MNDLFTIELPHDAGRKLADIRKAVTELNGVVDCGTLTTRTVDPSTVGLWVQYAVDVAGAASALTGLLESVFSCLSRNKIKGAKLKVGEIELELSDMSEEQFSRILTRLEHHTGIERRRAARLPKGRAV